MREYSKRLTVLAATVAAVLFFSVTALAAVQNIKGVVFTDSVIVYGKVVKMTAEALSAPSLASVLPPAASPKATL